VAPAEAWPHRGAHGAPASGRILAREVAESVSRVAQRGGRAGGGGGRRGSSGSSGSSREEQLFSEGELRELEATYAEGITAAQVVDLFVSRGVRFSEATFRKYVQQGLLPRSRRVGRKGKHRRSLGVYPAKTVRRVNDIKQLMADNYTIEAIKDQFLLVSDVVETVEESLGELFGRLETEIQGDRFDAKARRELKRELSDAKKTADDLIHRLEGLSGRVSARGDRYGDTGAAGSAEELL